MFKHSLVLLLCAGFVGQAGETKKDDALTEAKDTVVKHVTDLKGENFKAALVACIPAPRPRLGLEMALDFHNEPFYGKREARRLGLATSRRPTLISFGPAATRSSRTAPSSSQTSISTPGASPARSRIAAGMTSRPALSMVVRMALDYHASW